MTASFDGFTLQGIYIVVALTPRTGDRGSWRPREEGGRAKKPEEKQGRRKEGEGQRGRGIRGSGSGKGGRCTLTSVDSLGITKVSNCTRLTPVTYVPLSASNTHHTPPTIPFLTA